MDSYRNVGYCYRNDNYNRWMCFGLHIVINFGTCEGCVVFMPALV